MNYKVIRLNVCLEHHGVLGQRWGRKNGPPYPLGLSDHSPSEKKAGWKKSLGGGRNTKLYGRDKKSQTKSFLELQKARVKKNLNKDSGDGYTNAENIVRSGVSIESVKMLSDLRKEIERNEDVSNDDAFVMEVFNKFDPDDPKYEQKVIDALNEEQDKRESKYKEAIRKYDRECEKITKQILGDLGNRKISEDTTYNDLLKKNVDLENIFDEATFLYQIYEEYY